MSGRAVLLVWAGLLAGLVLQFGLAFSAAPRLVLPGIALCMLGLVGFGFMRLRASGTLATIFAAAGVFWLCVMLCLGSMDAATRTDISVTQNDVHLPSGGMPPR